MRRKTTAVMGSLFVIAIGFEGCRPFLSVDASNFKKPHAHTVKVPPFKPGDPHVKLDGKACAILKGGKPYSVSPTYPGCARPVCSQRLSPDRPADARRQPGPLAATRKRRQTQVETDGSGRGLVVQDVDAPTRVVWER